MPYLARVLGLVLVVGFAVSAGQVQADNGYPYPETNVIKTTKNFGTLFKDLEAAVSELFERVSSTCFCAKASCSK